MFGRDYTHRLDDPVLLDIGCRDYNLCESCGFSDFYDVRAKLLSLSDEFGGYFSRVPEGDERRVRFFA